MSPPKWISCPSCRALVEPGTRSCPYCSAAIAGRSEPLDAPAPAVERPGLPLVTRTLVLICLVFYVAELVVQSVAFGHSATGGGVLGFLGVIAGVHALFGGPAIGQSEGLWVVATYGFLHGGILHIVMNLMALRVLGPLCEILYGRWRMIVLCAVSTLGGGLLCLAFGERAIGFSGAICGLLGAALVHSRRTGQTLAYQQLLNAVIFIAVISLVIPGISIFGHLGGFLGGVLFAWLTLHRSLRFLRDRRMVRLLGVASITLFAAAYGMLAAAILAQVPYRHFEPVRELGVEMERRLEEERRLPPPESYPRARAVLERARERTPAWRDILVDWQAVLDDMEARVRERGGETRLEPRDAALEARFRRVVERWVEWWRANPDPHGFRTILAYMERGAD